MGRLAGFTHRELTARLRRLGWAFDRHGPGSHEIWRRERDGHKVTLPHHPGDIAEGTLRAILRDAWDPARTLVLSEFGANLPWTVHRAMQRNRTICGLSRAMVLIEARTTGGSIEAGRECLRMRRPLFAAVYEGSPETATGNAELLHNGARRLMKSRSRDLPNIAPILDAIAATPSGTQTTPAPPQAPGQLFRDANP